MAGGNSHQRATEKTAKKRTSGEMAETTVLQRGPLREPKKPLGRSTVEAYVGIIGAVGYAALNALGITVNFWLGLLSP
jgi:hypothetical protein